MINPFAPLCPNRVDPNGIKVLYLLHIDVNIIFVHMREWRDVIIHLIMPHEKEMYMKIDLKGSFDLKIEVNPESLAKLVDLVLLFAQAYLGQ